MIQISKSSQKSLVYYTILVLILVTSTWVQLRLPKPKLPPPTAYIPPPLAVQYFAAGFRKQLAASLWLRSMGDLDYCEKLINTRDCVGKSWLFSIFDLATELDPRFEPVFYQVGGLALTVIISDYAGASVIFDKGVKQHPEYWQLTYAAAYHAHFEEKNYAKAGQLYSLAAQHGAPTWVSTLAGRMAVDGGDAQLADQILRSMIDMKLEEKYIERLRKKIEQARAENKLESQKSSDSK